ncbi:substrate-binding domain-containing protein [Actinomadura sp. NBRC 104412]|uniref:substrate-binding domain-containing protein n=1 Tax=Actinomadura sp. NBRC 104412 TaxID=3032203 RepID=UPI0025562828|nr:substrate-binding domain-containing protein [Actinomadura sp. NBRC 104412]
MRTGLATVILLAVCSLGAGVAAPEARAATLVNGSGSTYVELAMDEWTRSADARGIKVNYTGVGSPTGVGQYDARQTDYAGTEAEVKSLYGGRNTLPRGFQYVPDVAGAIAIMYNVRDRGGNRYDKLHLDQRTISRIFTGEISNWSHPDITRTNGGVALPDQPIRVVFRTGSSGTTALFYDFVREAARDVYDRFRSKHNLPDRRITSLPDTPNDVGGQFAPNIVGRGGSDEMAQFVGSSAWSIGYDEFGYAIKHGVDVAWVKNGAGKWTKPYALNISEALRDATLRPDLSQELSGVYTSKNPLAYPISAYSYMMTQCLPGRGRQTCAGPYSDGGKQSTLAQFMRYVACDGQVKMARIGYSPLPTNLSQEMENSVARMTGERPRRLTPGNCANPRFHGSLGAGAGPPRDPFENLPGGVDGATSGGRNSAGPSASATAGSGSGAGAGLGTVAGGSGRQQNAKPVGFNGPGVPGLGPLPALVLIGALVVPPAVMAIRNRNRARP